MLQLTPRNNIYQLCKQEVDGSIPFVSTNHRRMVRRWLPKRDSDEGVAARLDEVAEHIGQRRQSPVGEIALLRGCDPMVSLISF